MRITPLRERPAWKELEAHFPIVPELHLRRPFAEDPGRGERLMAEANCILLDFSKNPITDDELVGAFLHASPSHEARHERRLLKIQALEDDPPRPLGAGNHG